MRNKLNNLTMADNQNILQRKHPDEWDLTLCVSRRGIRYLFTPAEGFDGETQRGEIAIAQTGQTYLARIEDIFYDNEGLVDDFHAVRIIFESDIFMTIPEAMIDENEANDATLLRSLFHAFSGNVLTDSTSIEGVHIIYGVEDGIAPFFRRTYYNATFEHALSPVMRMCAQMHGNDVELFATLIGETAYIVGYDRRSMIVANAYTFRTDTDAAYYIINAWQQGGYDSLNDSIIINATNSSEAERLQSIISRYVSHVSISDIDLHTTLLGLV